ncbi:MAG TPA: hypothetical protein VJK51_03610 [Candidatus Nanoarchaeia archaeon]|nr:hypothetical protein [Candidatus Nanoarchaeia archaeon]
MDYVVPDRRRSKNDKRAKGRFNKYKRGGVFRVTGLDVKRK